MCFLRSRHVLYSEFRIFSKLRSKRELNGVFQIFRIFEKMTQIKVETRTAMPFSKYHEFRHFLQRFWPEHGLKWVFRISRVLRKTLKLRGRTLHVTTRDKTLIIDTCNY